MNTGDNFLNNPEKTDFAIIGAAIVFIAFLGAAFLTEPKAIEGPPIDAPKDSNEPVSVEKQECPLSYECCMGEWFEKKECREGKCVKFRCVIEECTEECCEEEGVEEKKCGEGLECLNNRCVKPECPHECCNSSGEYRVKACDGNYKCENNKCVQDPCEEECCVNDYGIEDKPCENGLECAGNECKKLECPTLCCPPRDPVYEEKKCPSHQKCVGKICVPRI